MRILSPFILSALLLSCSVVKKGDLPVSMPVIEKNTAEDSSILVISFYENSPIAAKLAYTIKKNGQIQTNLYYYTHRFRNNKLLVSKTSVESHPLLSDIMKKEASLLKRAEIIEGYKLGWLDGIEWSVAIHDEKGLRTYKYPELFEQPTSPEIQRIQELITNLDNGYSIEQGRWHMNLPRGKYTNYGGTEIRKK